MREGKSIFALLLLLLFIAVVSLIVGSNLFNISLFFSDLYISSYQCEINISKTNIINSELISLGIHEEYQFAVEGNKKMLFRYWEVPLIYNREIDKLSGFNSKEESVILLDLESKSGIPYVKDNKGNVYLERIINQRSSYVLSQHLVGEIIRDALTNEVGIVSKNNLNRDTHNLQYFDKGEHSLKINYLAYFKYRTDKNNSHVNIMLANQHIPYKKVRIVIKDNEEVISEVYPHLSSKPFLSTLFLANKELTQTLSSLLKFPFRKEGNTYIIEGISPEDKTVGVEILMRQVPILGIEEKTTGVAFNTKLFNTFESILYWTKVSIDLIITLVIILLPFYVLLIYLKHGKEKFTLVPEYISFIPNENRKPWVVNGIFVGIPEKTNRDGFFATLWDLERRGVLSIDEEGITIKNSEDKDLDKYEKDLISFLTRYSTGKRFEFKEFEEVVKSYYQHEQALKLKEINRDFNEIFYYSTEDISDKFIDKSGYDKIIKSCLLVGIPTVAISLLLYILSINFAGYIYFADLFSKIFGFVVMFATLLLTPSNILGRWRDDFYKEKLEWEAFAKFLSDLANIDEVDITKNDQDVWKKWFVYANALGVGNIFLDNLKKLGLNIPEISKNYYTNLGGFTRVYNTTSSYASSKGSGGYGGSGGSGGGGAGGR
ncbi:MAG: DUF2207 domain-containing protein [Spirochaetes bacterium]|nr:DUF2207 domain-containing protein [Spirochaetota bacterium]